MGQGMKGTVKRIIFLLLVTAAVAGGNLGWRGAHQEQGIRVLDSVVVGRGAVRKVLEETGIIKSQVGAIVKIGARATGTIERMLVKVGDSVKKGQLVAVIDSRELRSQEEEAGTQLATAEAELTRVRKVYPLQIREARAQLAQARAQGDYLSSNYQRQRVLLQDGVISQDDLENARQKARAQADQVMVLQATLERLRSEFRQQEKKARFAVENARASLKAIRIRISYTRIESPIAGIVSDVTAQEGETIVAGLQVANLITVLDPNRLEMWVYVDETDVGQVRSGQKVEFRVDAYPDKLFKGSIDTIYPVPEIRDNIVYYRALVDVDREQARFLRPEMTTQVQIVVAERDDVLKIPNTALKWVDGRQVVFVQEGDGTVREVVPTLGLAGIADSEVLTGLKAGERVATQVSLPRNGARGAGR
jgi:HlyD family secretion protein